MNKSTLRNLGIVLFALIAIMVALEVGEQNDSGTSGNILIPGLKDGVNSVTSIVIERADADAVSVLRQSGDWVVENKGGYPASVSKIREILLAIADARILERKTANPELYSALGVRDPEIEDSEGVRLTVAGEGVGAAIIVGNANQGSNRYVRIVDEAQSLLIDKNPELPTDASGWLEKELVDIDGAAVRAARISHVDGDEIRVEKTSAQQTDFDVVDIPEARELSYSTVANGIGSALSDLTLDDVRTAEETAPTTVTTLETFDGRTITVNIVTADEESWVSFVAAYAPPAVEPEGAEPGDNDAEASAVEEPSAGESEDPAAATDTFNARVAGWQFKLPDFKVNQLTRRWEDILKEETEE